MTAVATGPVPAEVAPVLMVLAANCFVAMLVSDVVADPDVLGPLPAKSAPL